MAGYSDTDSERKNGEEDEGELIEPSPGLTFDAMVSFTMFTEITLVLFCIIFYLTHFLLSMY